MTVHCEPEIYLLLEVPSPLLKNGYNFGSLSCVVLNKEFVSILIQSRIFSSQEHFGRPGRLFPSIFPSITNRRRPLPVDFHCDPNIFWNNYSQSLEGIFWSESFLCNSDKVIPFSFLSFQKLQLNGIPTLTTKNWIQTAQQRLTWKPMEKVCVQERISVYRLLKKMKNISLFTSQLIRSQISVSSNF